MKTQEKTASVVVSTFYQSGEFFIFEITTLSGKELKFEIHESCVTRKIRHIRTGSQISYTEREDGLLTKLKNLTYDDHIAQLREDHKKNKQ